TRAPPRAGSSGSRTTSWRPRRRASSSWRRFVPCRRRGTGSLPVEDSPIVLPDDPSLGPEVQVDYPGYRSTRWRGPDRYLVALRAPNVSCPGRCPNGEAGRYRYVTVKPGAYPWGNHENAWRPAHIHFSLFGRTFTQRLVTQMYFPGDPLFPYDPIFNSVRDPR